MIEGYRTLQIFLSRTTGEIDEVAFKQGAEPPFICTCDDHLVDQGICLHIALVESRLRGLGGSYVFPRVPDDIIEKAREMDLPDFRQFVLQHAPVELI